MRNLILLLLSSLTLSAAPIIIEAEDGVLQDVSVHTSQAGFSGSGYVADFSVDNSEVTVTVNAPAAGSYNLKIIYYDANSRKIQDVYVNGASSGQLVMEASNTFDTADIGGAALLEIAVVRSSLGRVDMSMLCHL